MRLLICSLYFPPCTLTPANRTFSWTKYLHQFGIYPVIITRQWPVAFSPDLYEERSIGSEVIIEKHPDYEVHFLPFKGNYRTRSLEKDGESANKMRRRFFWVFELLFSNLFHNILPYGNMFNYILNYTKENNVDKILISGSPFQLFKIGFKIKKKYGIPWIADYRDGWTGANHDYHEGILGKLQKISNKYFEKKWLHTAEYFITVSPYLKSSIEKVTGIRGYEIYNGFYADEQVMNNTELDKKNIVFLYSGTMYPSQDYKTVVAVFKKLIIAFRNKININIQFLGTVYKDPVFRNDAVFKGYESNFIFTERVSYQEALMIHEKADVFLMLSYRGAKGITTSKIFDYIKYHKPVVLFPSDFDIVEELLIESGLGIIAETEASLEEKLAKIIIEKLENGFIKPEAVNEDYINSFSRENQARRLAEIIKQ